MSTVGRPFRRLQAAFRGSDAPCSICRGALGAINYEPVDPLRDPYAFQMDMLVPKSRGGDPDDPYNYRPVHRWCNISRKNRTDAYVRKRIAQGYGPNGPNYRKRSTRSRNNATNNARNNAAIVSATCPYVRNGACDICVGVTSPCPY